MQRQKRRREHVPAVDFPLILEWFKAPVPPLSTGESLNVPSCDLCGNNLGPAAGLLTLCFVPLPVDQWTTKQSGTEAEHPPKCISPLPLGVWWGSSSLQTLVPRGSEDQTLLCL